MMEHDDTVGALLKAPDDMGADLKYVFAEQRLQGTM
jgi:hypothetical protein